MEKVIVVSTQGNVSISNPELNFRRTWDKKGTRVPIDIEKLEELLYDYGVQNLFNMGYLYIDKADEETKQNLGILDEHITLNDTQLGVLLNVKPLNEFKEMLPKLSFACRENLIALAKQSTSVDGGKILAMKEILGVDVTPAIAMNLREM